MLNVLSYSISRLALSLAGVPFEDKRIVFSEWKDVKPTTPFGQLPMMTIDNDKVRSQSEAMLRWIGSELAPESNLYPKELLFDIEEAMGLVVDMSNSWTPCLYIGMSPEAYGHPADLGATDQGKQLIKTVRENWVRNQLPRFLTYLTTMLEKNNEKFLASEHGPTIVDCLAVPFLRGFTRGHIDHVPTNCLESHPKVIDYIKRFCALPAIQGRYSSGLH